MTYPSDAYPTDEPPAQIHIAHLRFSHKGGAVEGTVPDRQLWVLTSAS
jgi:hypothetical protein